MKIHILFFNRIEVGELYLFRTYQRENAFSGRFVIFNEWGEIVGYEVYGASKNGVGINLLERQDYLGRTLYRYEYDDTGYWEYDVVNDKLQLSDEIYRILKTNLKIKINWDDFLSLIIKRDYERLNGIV